MAKITRLSLYVINNVKVRRIFLGYSAEHLSILLKRSHGYALTAENPKLKSQYPPHEWPIIAKELNCTVHDLLPADDMDQISTGELVDKVVLNISHKADLKLIVQGLISYGFFDRSKTIENITKHLEMKKEEQVDLLVGVMGGFIRDGNLKQEKNSFVH